MRVWKDPFTDEHEEAMNEVLVDYREHLFDDFMSIFDEIDGMLDSSVNDYI